MKRAQAFIFDYIISILVFVVIIVSGIALIQDILPDTSYDFLVTQHQYVADQLMTSGFPQDWNESSVILPGVIDTQRVNQTKLLEFLSLDYAFTKQLFGLEGEYYFFFRNSTNTIPIYECGFGSPDMLLNGCDPDTSGLIYDHFVKSSRLVIYQDRIIEMVLYTWK